MNPKMIHQFTVYFIFVCLLFFIKNTEKSNTFGSCSLLVFAGASLHGAGTGVNGVLGCASGVSGGVGSSTPLLPPSAGKCRL